MDDVYCSMIHGGLNLNFKTATPSAQNCCLRNSLSRVDVSSPFWNNQILQDLRQTNLKKSWSPGCFNCKKLEESNIVSMRQGMNDGLGIQGQVGLSGPVRLDLMFDISCNLACRTCNVESSTYWQKHLKQHGEWDKPIFTPKSKFEVIAALKNLDLSNLKMLVFCGGETLLGQEYWDVADWVVNSVPNAKDNLILCFQTNGTQPILEKNFHIVDKVKLVKLHISLDGVGPVFEYLRWPASWQQVCDNIAQLKETLPSNVMFHVEETISVLNLAYQGELDSWVQQNFSSSKYNDPVEHTKHLAGGIFSLQNCSEEYYAEISRTQYKSLLPLKFQENKKNIEKMIAQIKKIDSYRDQDLKIFLPEVAKFYQRFI